MSSGHLTIDLGALADNWRALDAKTACETAAVVKADGYGIGLARAATALARAGARRFFVALAEEGAALRAALGPGPMIGVFSGHMEGDTQLIRNAALTPMLNSVDQMLRQRQGGEMARAIERGDYDAGYMKQRFGDKVQARDFLAAAGLLARLGYADDPERLGYLIGRKAAVIVVDAPRNHITARPDVTPSCRSPP